MKQEKKKEKDATASTRQDKKMKDRGLVLRPMYHGGQFLMIELFIEYFSLSSRNFFVPTS